MKTWFAKPLWLRVMVGLVLGLLSGLVLHYGIGGETGPHIAEVWLKPFGDAFVRLIQMLVIPLIFTTLVAGVIAMGDPKKLGSLGGKAVMLYFSTTAFAVSLGLFIGALIKPGKGVSYTSASTDSQSSIIDKLQSAGEVSVSLTDKILHIIPTNPVEAMSTADVLAVIFFAIMLGIGILAAGDKARTVSTFFEEASEVIQKLTMIVMEVAPFGVFALMAWVMGTQGIGLLLNLSKLAIALYLACFLHILFVYGGLIKIVLKLPMVRFIKGMADAIGVAYSTSSSNATLPVTIACVHKNLGVDKSIAASILPLGATVNMDGTAIYLGIVATFAAQALGIELTMADYLMVGFTATMASIGTAGIPSASLFLASTVLAVFGVGQADAVLIIAFIFPFDRLLDMMRTVTNICGDAAVATTVAKWQGGLDEDVFRNKETSIENI
ncbi:MAG: dicarboxylate/amino acid:cation symporter [Alphaproteobacteria bacterium]|nr:MAG: dicarboxylate/amino acid:cation symporter [Alphaproteobacteria bacterium]